jgi:hypothetical protein
LLAYDNVIIVWWVETPKGNYAYRKNRLGMITGVHNLTLQIPLLFLKEKTSQRAFTDNPAKTSPWLKEEAYPSY